MHRPHGSYAICFPSKRSTNGIQPCPHLCIIPRPTMPPIDWMKVKEDIASFFPVTLQKGVLYKWPLKRSFFLISIWVINFGHLEESLSFSTLPTGMQSPDMPGFLHLDSETKASKYIMTPSTKPFECCYHISTHRTNVWSVLPTFAKKTILHVGKYTKNSIEPTIYSMMFHVCHSKACMFGVSVLQPTRCFCLTFPFHTSCKRVVSMGGSEASCKPDFPKIAGSCWRRHVKKMCKMLEIYGNSDVWNPQIQVKELISRSCSIILGILPTYPYYLPLLLLLLLKPLALLHDRTAG